MQQYSLFQRVQGALTGSAFGQTYFTTQPIDAIAIAIQRCIQWLCNPTEHDPPSLPPDAHQIALNLLPLWLYCHESWRQRQRWLEQIPDWSTCDPKQAVVWLYGEAIAQAVRPGSETAQLVHHLIQQCQYSVHRGAPKLPDIWQRHLIQIQQWHHQRVCLAPIQLALRNHSDAERSLMISLICFLQNPQDLTLAISRAAQCMGRHDPILGGLLGGLFGAYHGWHKLPIHQLAPLFTLQSPHNPMLGPYLSDPSAFSVAPFNQDTSQLLLAWSGNMLRSPLAQPNTTTFTAVPTVLSPR